MKDYLFFTIIIFILAWENTSLSIGLILWLLGGSSILAMIIYKQLEIRKEMEDYNKKLDKEIE